MSWQRLERNLAKHKMPIAHVKALIHSLMCSHIEGRWEGNEVRCKSCNLLTVQGNYLPNPHGKEIIDRQLEYDTY